MQKVRNFLNVNNVGYLDTVIRMLIGVAALLPALLQLRDPLFSALALLSIYPVVTALCRWDPIYELLDLRSTGKSIPQEQIVENFLLQSRRYIYSLSGMTQVRNDELATNEESQKRRSA